MAKDCFNLKVTEDGVTVSNGGGWKVLAIFLAFLILAAAVVCIIGSNWCRESDISKWFGLNSEQTTPDEEPPEGEEEPNAPALENEDLSAVDTFAFIA